MSDATKINDLKAAITLALGHLRMIGGQIDVVDDETQALLEEVSKCHDNLKTATLIALK